MEGNSDKINAFVKTIDWSATRVIVDPKRVDYAKVLSRQMNSDKFWNPSVEDTSDDEEGEWEEDL